MNPLLKIFVAASIATFCSAALSGVSSTIGKEAAKAVEAAAQRSGRNFESEAAKKVAIAEAERLASAHGNGVLKVVEDGGLEIMPTITKHGDDFVKMAAQASPAGRRALATSAPDLLPLARRVGVDAVELEAKAPGQASHVFQLFGDDAGKTVAKTVRTEDLPRFIKYGEKADSEGTRNLLLKTYQKEGPSLFERIPPKVILAGGLSAAMLLGTYEAAAEDRAKADVLQNNPDIAKEVMLHATTVNGIVGGIVILVLIFVLLWRFGLMPGQRRKP
jgi:hypothetical protein